MKPICTIYWVRDGTEEHRRFYNENSIEFFVNSLKREDVCYWICWTSLNAKVVA